MFRWKFSFFFLISIFSPLSSFCQADSSKSTLDLLAERLNKSAQFRPIESIYLQTNKGIYDSGEDLWFKAYVLRAQSFAPSSLSKTLFLQLMNENSRKMVWQEMYEIKDGFGDGHVYLPDSLSEGNYLLQAFTAHSLSSDSGDFKALRKIRVVKNYKSITASTITNIPNTDINKETIQFNVFPEGGKLINGLVSKLAYKAVNEKGEPLNVSGTLFEEDQALQSFKSEHDGMGTLTFTPTAGKKYHIRLSEPNTSQVFPLPEISSQGLALSFLSQDSSNLVFSVGRIGGSVAKVYLRGQLRGQTMCMASALLDQKIIVKMPLKEFSQQGIAEFTLFDENLQPVAERLVFMHPEKKLYITAQLSKPQFKLRQKAELKIKVHDEKGQPVIANLGVSVFDKLYKNAQDPKNILNHYYLSEQLKGRIYDPLYYFDQKHTIGEREKALDLLLLTQGWRNYVWDEENLTASKAVKPQIISDGITGQVSFTKKIKHAPKEGELIQAYSVDEKGSNKFSSYLQTDTLENFMITSPILKAGQGAYLYVKPISMIDFAPVINLEMPFITINKWINKKQMQYPLADNRIITKDESLNTKELRPMFLKLKEVEIKSRAANTFRDKYLGHLDSLAKASVTSDFVCLYHHDPPMLNCFRKHPLSQRRVPIDGERVMVSLGKDKEILGADYALDYYYEDRVIIYHNPNLNFTEDELLKRNNLTKIKGYYPQKEFYQPDYDKEPAGDGLADARNNLLWAPNVTTDKNGEATLSFFCSDINSGFIGKIEGVSSSGLLGVQQVEFSVVK